MTGGFEIVAKDAIGIVLKGAMQRILKARSDEATHIIIEELRTAKIDPDEVAERDDVAAMLVSFYMAMAQGAAFRNLRVLAKVLSDKAAHPNERPDDFMMWASSIASLGHEEVVLLATFFREFGKAQSSPIEGEATVVTALNATKSILVGPSNTFKFEPDFYGAFNALGRTGFIFAYTGWGGQFFLPTSRLIRLAEIANLQDWADSERERP